MYETKGIVSRAGTWLPAEPQGIGSHGTDRAFFDLVDPEGMADAVRATTVTSHPRTGGRGTLVGWIPKPPVSFGVVNNKRCRFSQEVQPVGLEVIPWSFDGAIKHVLGQEYSIDELWRNTNSSWILDAAASTERLTLSTVASWTCSLYMLYRRHGKVRKELDVKIPFQTVEKRFCLKTL